MNAKLLIGLGLALALGACVSTPQPNAALVTARSAVQSAESDPNVEKKILNKKWKLKAKKRLLLVFFLSIERGFFNPSGYESGFRLPPIFSMFIIEFLLLQRQYIELTLLWSQGFRFQQWITLT